MTAFDHPGLLAAVVLGGYILGSVPFGLVLCRLAGYGDIRTIGSGNIGATNVLRTGNKPLAVITLLLDSGKGGAAVLLAGLYSPDPVLPLLAGAAAVVGHNFPVWLGFKGGKGVATIIGTLLAAAWPVGVAVCVVWLLCLAVFRYSSLSAIVSLGVSPALAWFLIPSPENCALTVMAAVLGVLAIVRHHANIRRLINGDEPKVGQKKT